MKYGFEEFLQDARLRCCLSKQDRSVQNAPGHNDQGPRDNQVIQRWGYHRFDK